ASVEAEELRAAVREERRLVGQRADVARAEDERPGVALKANRRIEAAASRHRADVGGRADAGLDGELRRPDDRVHAMLEEVVREREVAAVAEQRRAQKAGVGVIAAVVDAERRAVAADADA